MIEAFYRQGVGEAPLDGGRYVRSMGAWTPESVGGGSGGGNMDFGFVFDGALQSYDWGDLT